MHPDTPHTGTARTLVLLAVFAVTFAAALTAATLVLVAS